MAWPKKGTRKLTVNNEVYLWHYSGHCPLCSKDVFTIGMAGKPYVLFIDPFPHAFEMTPASVAQAIQWAVENGWTPDRGPTRAMVLDEIENRFVWLADGKRHLNCAGDSG